MVLRPSRKILDGYKGQTWPEGPVTTRAGSRMGMSSDTTEGSPAFPGPSTSSTVIQSAKWPLTHSRGPGGHQSWQSVPLNSYRVLGRLFDFPESCRMVIMKLALTTAQVIVRVKYNNTHQSVLKLELRSGQLLPADTRRSETWVQCAACCSLRGGS